MLRSKKKEKGFALVIVLVMMQMLAVLSWYAIANVLLIKKSVGNTIKRHRAWYQSMQILHRLEAEVLNQNPVCLIDPMYLVDKPLSWWQSSLTCTGNFQGLQYYYVVEFLGEDACAKVEYTQYIAAYYRITLFYESILLQTTIAKPSLLHESCQGMHHSVMLGRQSWRELTE